MHVDDVREGIIKLTLIGSFRYVFRRKLYEREISIGQQERKAVNEIKAGKAPWLDGVMEFQWSV